MCRTDCVELDFVLSRWHNAEGLDENASRHTGCPVTQGWTLPRITAKRPIRACNTKTSTTCNSINMNSMEAALAAIESLGHGEKLVYAQIARKYGVEPTTLARRHKGASTSLETRFQNQQALHPQQEQELLLYIKQLTRRGLPLTRAMIRNFGSQIARRQLGVNWVDRFIHWYPNELVLKWTTGIDNSRHKADSGRKYSLYFDLLREKN
jgi:hypothetical protein